MSHIKYLTLLLFIINYSGKQLLAQVNQDTCSKKYDSCALFMDRRENTLSISSQFGRVEKDQLSKGYSLNMLSELSGKINGVEIRTFTRGNSASSVIFMHGERNLISGNQPVFIVDGVPVISKFSSPLGFDYGNMLNDWNIDDIESITILKGGQAASIPVSMSGNGAVVVRTRNASEEGFHVDYSFSALQKRIADYPDFQNEYGQGYTGEFGYSDGLGGGVYDGDDLSWGPKLNGQLISQFDGLSQGWVNGQLLQVRGGDIWARQQAALLGFDNYIEPTTWVAQPDNVKNFFQTAFALSNNLGLSWANKIGGVRFAYTNVRADDILPESRFQKNNLLLNYNYTFLNRIKVFGSFQNSNLKDKNVLNATDKHMNSPMIFFTWMGRQVNTDNLKKYWQAGQDNMMQFNYIGIYYNNPYFVLKEQSAPVERNNIFGSYGVNLDIAKGFSLNYLGGFNTISVEGVKKIAEGNIGRNPVFSQSENLEQSISRHSLLLDYSLTLWKTHRFNSFAGVYFEKFKSHELYTLSQQNFGEASSEIKTHGSFWGISYVANNAWSIRVRLNQDKYNYSVKVNSPIYYAVSGGVEINRLLHLPDVLSTLNMQTGYSKRGLNSISTVGEYTVSANLGMFNDRIISHINYYSSKTKDGLLLVTISWSGGFGTDIANTASVKNSGYELSLDIIPVHSQTVCWKAAVSFYKNINEIVELDKGIINQQQYSKGVSVLNEVGQPMGNIFGRKFKRFEGQVIFKNGLPEMTEHEELLGNVNPDYLIYISNSITIKKLTILLDFEFSKGGEYYSPFYSTGTFAGNLANTADRENGIVGDGVKWDDLNGNFVTNNVNVSAQDYFMNLYNIDEYSIMDATFLKLKEINISYHFILKQKVKMVCSIFGQNLFTWSGNKDYNNGNLLYSENMYYRGINNYNLPETYILGIKFQLHI